jgi:hypothetical protein
MLPGVENRMIRNTIPGINHESDRHRHLEPGAWVQHPKSFKQPRDHQMFPKLASGDRMTGWRSILTSPAAALRIASKLKT